MALALRVVPAATTACCHPDSAFVEYAPTKGGYPDDTMTQVGRCIGCNRFLELWVSVSTGEIFNERDLSPIEVKALRRDYQP